MDQDSQIQSIVVLFDHCMGYLDPENEDEILLYHLIACLYICFKTDKAFSSLTFENYLYQVVTIPTYDELKNHLAPHLEHCIWTHDLFPRLEREILGNALNFKTKFVSAAEVVSAIGTTLFRKV